MIVLACIRLLSTPNEHLGHPPVANVNGLPNLFGACVYSFMCHHVNFKIIILILRLIFILLFSLNHLVVTFAGDTNLTKTRPLQTFGLGLHLDCWILPFAWVYGHICISSSGRSLYPKLCS